MIREIPDLSEQLSSVHETMVGVSSIKNAALLRNLTDLRVVVSKETRWSWKYHMRMCFVRTRDDILKASMDGTSSIPSVRTSTIFSGVQKHTTMLSEINAVTKNAADSSL